MKKPVNKYIQILLLSTIIGCLVIFLIKNISENPHWMSTQKLINFSVIEFDQKNYEKANKLLHIALDNKKVSRSQGREIYVLLAKISYLLNTGEQTLIYLKNAADILPPRCDFLIRDITELYKEINQNNKGIQLIRRTLDICSEIERTDLKILLAEHLLSSNQNHEAKLILATLFKSRDTFTEYQTVSIASKLIKVRTWLQPYDDLEIFGQQTLKKLGEPYYRSMFMATLAEAFLTHSQKQRAVIWAKQAKTEYQNSPLQIEEEIKKFEEIISHSN